tara:strand:+ start:1576 stop:2070 length:495 start_codon:yes stop_codon:yes gene_type:complete
MAEKPKRPWRDDADWYPFYLKREGGVPAAKIAIEATASINTVYCRIKRIRDMSPEQRDDLRKLAMDRLHARRDGALFTADTVEAQRLTAALTAWVRCEREERKTRMETRDTQAVSENKKGKLSDDEIERLRTELHRRLILRQPAQRLGFLPRHSNGGTGGGAGS